MEGTNCGKKPLYCHWDSHEQDVLFMDENELDQHIYSHFCQFPDSETPQTFSNQEPEVPKPEDKKTEDEKFQQTVECHWDACHELFDIDEIMEHFKNSHMEVSHNPHDRRCMPHEVKHCNESHHESDFSNNSNESYYAVPSSVSSLSSNLASPLVQSPNYQPPQPAQPPQHPVKIDISNLPKLSPRGIPEGEDAMTQACMWLTPNGVCGQRFFTTNELNAHIVHTHINQTDTTCMWDGCKRTNVPFNHRQKIIRHIQVHARTTDHRCRMCDRTMCSEALLKTHELRHMNEWPFKCEVCERCFRTKNSLNVHMRTHTGAKPLVCTFPGCGKRFAESSNLAKHRRTHMAPQFMCPVCSRMFTRKDHLRRHMRTKNHFEEETKPPATVPAAST